VSGQKRIIPIISQKGGVGKSTVARAVVDIARSSGIVTAAFDADGGVGHLLSHYGQRNDLGRRLADQDPLQGVGYFRLHDGQSRDRLVNVIDTLDADLIVIDMPGGTLDVLENVLPGGVRELLDVWESEGWETRPLHVITGLRSCAEEVLHVLDALGEAASRLRVCRNLGFSHGRVEAFFLFDGGGEFKGNARQRLELSGGKALSMPELRYETYVWIDAKRYTFADALKSEDPGNRGDRRWLRDFLAKFEAELRGADVL
jgi:hypothetical protein